MALLKQTTARTRAFLLVGSSDHITGLTGASPVVQTSANGGSFTSPSLVASEIANGWYAVPLTTTDTATLGDLAFHITAASADPTDFLDQVVADLPGASVSSVTGAVGSVTGNVGGNVVGSVASVTGAVASVTGNVGGNVSGSVGSISGVTFPGHFSSLIIDTSGKVTASSSSSVLVSGSVTVGTNNDKTGYTLTAQERGSIVASTWSTVQSESYSAKGAVPSPVQAIFQMNSLLAEKSVSATSVSMYQVDGATVWATYTLDSTSPTTIHRGA